MRHENGLIPGFFAGFFPLLGFLVLLGAAIEAVGWILRTILG